MISKTKEVLVASNKYERAGQAAEEQMAFYLRRAFGDTKDVFVFNDLRLVDGDDAAQIDHLVLHRFGFFIVESKSISGEVVINEHGEWIRVWGGAQSGMRSPIQQARLQGEFLRRLLNQHKEELRDKALFGKLQFGFKHCPIDVCAAISDGGIIKRRGETPPEACRLTRCAIGFRRRSSDTEKHLASYRNWMRITVCGRSSHRKWTAS